MLFMQELKLERLQKVRKHMTILDASIGFIIGLLTTRHMLAALLLGLLFLMCSWTYYTISMQIEVSRTNKDMKGFKNDRKRRNKT